MKTDIRHLIDINKVNTLLEGFNKSTGFVSAILDLEGNVLSKSGWRPICTEFHRINPETSKSCTISDTVLANNMEKGEKYHSYKCLNGLMDVAVPLKINGEHVANLFSGQFLFEEPDVAFFKKQAAAFGFDKEKYLVALSKVPVVSEQKVKMVMDFLLNMTEFISDLTIQKLEQEELTQDLKNSETKYKAIFESTGTAMLIVDEDTTVLMANNECLNITGYDSIELIGQKWTSYVAQESMQEMLKNHQLRCQNPDLAPRKYEVKLLNKKGEKRDAVLNIDMIPGTKQSVVSILDITERKQAEMELLKSKSNLEEYFENDISADYVVAVSGEIFSCNKTFLNLFGFEEKSETEKFDMTDLYKNPVDRNQLIRMVQKQGKVENHEVEFISKEGKIIFALINAIGIFDMDDKLEKIRGYIVDISEQKNIEKELKQSEKKYRLLFAKNPQPMWIYDLETLAFLEVNHAAVIHYGYSKEEFLSMTLKDIRPVEDIPVLIEDIKKTRSDLNTDGTRRHIKKNGEIINVEISSQGVLFNDREARHILINDITKRKFFETELLKLSRAVEQNPTSIIITDLDGNIEYANIKTLEITGYTKEELIGKNPRIFSSGEKPKSEYQQLWNTISTGNEWFGEFHNKKKNGELYWESASISPILNEKQKIINYLAIKEDITERKKFIEDLKFAKEKAEESEAQFRLIYENSVNPIMWAEAKTGKIIACNPASKILTEYDSQELIGQSFTIIIPQEQLSVTFSKYKKHQQNKKTKSIESQIITKSGKIKDIELTATNIEINGKEISQAIFIDITSRIQKEKELIAAKEKAEESDRLKSAFLANMSHEIRTPMNGILGFTELLLEPDLSSEEKEGYINVVQQSGQRMLNTVNDIVEISKIEAGLVQLNLTETDINWIVEELDRFFQPEAAKKGIKLGVELLLLLDDKNIITDQNKLESILTNLIKNAIKYTPYGEIKVGCKVKKNNLEFYVKDTGIGIPAERQQAVFERFIQADIADKDARQGSGLGLAITKAYVEMLGGQIWLESQEEKGSTFFFTLPLYGQTQGNTQEKETGKQDDKSSQINGLNIIIAEDDKTSAFYLQTILKKNSNIILLTQSGYETVDACRNNPDTNLVLMDIQMAEMNGYEATREIRKFNKNVVIIAQTAFALTGDYEKAIKAGCNDYISKPINKEVLLEKIQKYF